MVGRSLRAAFSLCECRLDHFRGFEAIGNSENEPTAINGRWVKGPGARTFLRASKCVGEARGGGKLGVITPAVQKLRKEFGLPGIVYPEFAFGNDPQGPSFRPHNYDHDLVAYTGGHDNDTTVGWWGESPGPRQHAHFGRCAQEHRFATAYLNLRPGDEINRVLIRGVLASVADVAIVPLQDVLGLETAHDESTGTVAGTGDGVTAPKR